MDFASLIGAFAGIALICGAIFYGGDDPSIFVNIPGMMIVLGGTFAATLLTFHFKDVVTSFRAAFFVFTHDKRDANNTIASMVKLCNISRREGLVAMSKVETDSRFLKKACDLIADGAEDDLIRKALRTEIDSLKMRHFIVQDVFKKMGLYAPAFGMLGTLIGLVQMLSKMADPSSVGPAMAVAILTTFYGSLLATLFFNPIAGKLKAQTHLQVVELEIMFEGAISILHENNPLTLYEKLSSFIPARDRAPLERISYGPER